MLKPRPTIKWTLVLIILAGTLAACGYNTTTPDATQASNNKTTEGFISALINRDNEQGLNLFKSEAEVRLSPSISLTAPGYQGAEKKLYGTEQIGEWLTDFAAQAKNLRVDYTEYKVSGNTANWKINYYTLTPLNTEIEVSSDFEAIFEVGNIKSLEISSHIVAEYICLYRVGNSQCVTKAPIQDKAPPK